MTDTTTRKWINVDAGPRQIKNVEKALRDVSWEGKTFTRLSGVMGEPEGPYNRTTMTSPLGQARPETAEVLRAVGERFDYQVTRKTLPDILAALESARVALVASRPIEDERITQDEQRERNDASRAREVERAAESAIDDALRAEVIAKMPAGAKALIVAQCKEDQSDPMTDYFANSTTRCVAIGWRMTSREDFKRLHAVAGTFVETAHLASAEALVAWSADQYPEGTTNYVAKDAGEHRDNYSMGAGNYLSDHGWDGSGSGWVVKSYSVHGDNIDTAAAWWPRITEVHLPDPDAPVSNGADAVAGTDGVIVRAGTRAGYVELVFPAKPSEEVRNGLKSHGFRWARGNACWYGRDIAYANSVAGIAS
jgi:hypothetical protein